MSTSTYAALADAVLLLHAAFVALVVVGLALTWIGWWRGWQWTRSHAWRWTHVAAIVYVVVQTWLGVDCPLTVLENELRLAAGQTPYGEGFIAHWVGRLIFYDAPQWVFAVVYTLFGAAVVLTYYFYPPRRNAVPRPRL